MNILLWVLQIVLALLCISGGLYQVFKLDELKQGVAAMRALPRGVWTFFGVTGCLSGVFLILPGMGGPAPSLTWVAAAVVALQSALIAGLYGKYRDRAPLPYSVVMMLLGAVICYGRLSVAPL